MTKKSPKTKISEHDIQKLILDHLRYKKNIYVIRNNSFAGKIIRPNGSTGYIKNAQKGSPDIILCIKGRWVGLEIKTRHGWQSPDQKQAEAEIRRAGGEYYIVRTFEQYEEILNKYK